MFVFYGRLASPFGPYEELDRTRFRLPLFGLDRGTSCMLPCGLCAVMFSYWVLSLLALLSLSLTRFGLPLISFSALCLSKNAWYSSYC